MNTTLLQDEEIPSLEGKLQANFKVIAIYFVEPPKAEESLQKLHQMKDESVFTALSTLLSPNTTLAQAATVRVCVLVRGGFDFSRIILFPFFELSRADVLSFR